VIYSLEVLLQNKGDEMGYLRIPEGINDAILVSNVVVCDSLDPAKGQVVGTYTQVMLEYEFRASRAEAFIYLAQRGFDQEEAKAYLDALPRINFEHPFHVCHEKGSEMCAELQATRHILKCKLQPYLYDME
jgi:hypothetical protein